MDSLLYVGAGDDDDDDDDDESDDEGQETEEAKAKSAPAVDYEALQRAGYKTSTDLRATETYRQLTAKEEEDKEQEKLARAKAAEEKKAAEDARLEEEEYLLNRKKIDEKIGWEKRYDRTKEDFRAKEKRKRDQGQQSSSGDWVQEEKRRLRHGMTGNFDS